MIAFSGAAMAWPRLGYTLTNLAASSFGRLLEAQTGLTVLVVVRSGMHRLAGRRTDSRAAIAASRLISPLLVSR